MPACLLLLVITAAELARFEFIEPHMGTRFQITLYAPDEATARKASRAAFDRIAALDGIMSDYRPASELMRLCARAGGEPVVVSEDLFVVLDRARTVARQSGGAFDVTCGPVVRLWRRAKRTQKLPDRTDLSAALALVGSDKMILDARKRSVELTKAGMQLDLGGIAKGYAADEALKAMAALGVTRALVAAGGDVACGDAPPSADGWSVAVAPLDNPQDKPRRTLMLKNAAVSTSGDTEQWVEIDGVRYSHIVDPRTGLGLVGRSHVTVVAPNGMTADSLTKVVAVLGPDKGFAVLEQTPDVSSLVVRKTEKGEEELTSKGFAKVPQKETARPDR